MRIKLLILTISLTLLSFAFGITPVFAAISFSISNPQYNGDEVTIDISLSGLTSSSCPNSYCYLQAAFTSPSPIRYFGFTKNHNGEWYEYIGSPSTSYIQSTFFAFLPSDGTWSGQITLKINPDDPDYNGPGVYNIKAWRYTGNSNNYSGYTDPLSVNITGPTPTPSPLPTPTPSPSPSPSPVPTRTPTSISTSTPKKTSNPTNTPTPTSKPEPIFTPTPTQAKQIKKDVGYQIASVAAATAAATQTATHVKSEKQTNPFIWIGLIFIFAGVGSLGYIYIKKNAKFHIRLRR